MSRLRAVGREKRTKDLRRGMRSFMRDENNSDRSRGDRVIADDERFGISPTDPLTEDGQNFSREEMIRRNRRVTSETTDFCDSRFFGTSPSRSPRPLRHIVDSISLPPIMSTMVVDLGFLPHRFASQIRTPLRSSFALPCSLSPLRNILVYFILCPFPFILSYYFPDDLSSFTLRTSISHYSSLCRLYCASLTHRRRRRRRFDALDLE